jgi:ATP-dependent Clp protease adaptor protein ClpS
MILDIKTEELEEVDVLTDGDSIYTIVLYNDEYNTFDHVIDCLVKYCKHTAEQAEQCSLIVHYKGKCAVKSGGEKVLTPVCNALCRKGLSASIEEA